MTTNGGDRDDGTVDWFSEETSSSEPALPETTKSFEIPSEEKINEVTDFVQPITESPSEHLSMESSETILVEDDISENSEEILSGLILRVFSDEQAERVGKQLATLPPDLLGALKTEEICQRLISTRTILLPLLHEHEAILVRAALRSEDIEWTWKQNQKKN